MRKFLHTQQILLIAILFLAAFLRFWNLNSVPPSASMDEASIGYNAYSVLKTGRDEYGELPTLSHRSYDDWRRATYLYLVVPFVGLFGLDVVSVRLPAVILSIFTVLSTYYIVLLLFPKRSTFSESVALFSTFLLAISPWHIYISRIGHESNACLSFLFFGILFFLQSIENKSKSKLLVAMIFFILSMVSYYSGQAFIPLFIVGLLFIFRKNLMFIISLDKKTIFAFAILFSLSLFIFMQVFSKEALVRFQGTSIFRPEANWERFNQRVKLRNNALEKNDIFGIILYNRHVYSFQVFIEGYISHFNPEWLFTNPNSAPHKVPNMGLLYFWQIPFIAIGIIMLLFGMHLDRRMRQLVFLFFFLSPLPAAIATQAPHAMRSYSIILIWQIFTAFGLAYLLYRFQKFKNIVLITFFLFVLNSLLIFYKNYFILFPKEQSSSFQYSLGKAIPFVLKNEKSYNRIIFSNESNLYQSYMFFLFFSRFDPDLYQKNGGTLSGGFAEKHQIGKYLFRQIDWKKEQPGNLIVGNISDFPIGVNRIATFSNLDMKGAIIAVTK